MTAADDALNRLEQAIDERPHSHTVPWNEAKEALATVRDALQQARDERDAARRNMYEANGRWDAMWSAEQDAREAAEAEVRRLTERLDRVLYLAEHLWQMVPQAAWREHGAEWMGHYEGDYHAEKVRDELAEARALLADSPEGSA